MVLAKSKTQVGLGNALMNDRFGHGKGADRRKGSAGIRRTGVKGETYVTDAPKEASWVKMRSVTEQPALDEFLSTAELAGTDFTAEKMNNVKIIQSGQRNPYLLSTGEEQSAVRKHKANQNRLTVPRRPPWDETTTPAELDRREKELLLEWRRGLAELQETNDLLMTPFERNIEVWRQLWRVIERSDLVVQIVDARNPLMFRSEDLERYVKEVDSRKNNLLLVNKADMLTKEQRGAWADYFQENGVSYRYFSAALAKEMNELADPKEGEGDTLERYDLTREVGTTETQLVVGAEKPDIQRSEEEESQWASEDELGEGDHKDGLDVGEDQRTRILTVDELEALFLEHAPDVGSPEHPRKIQIGLVGYPNVGKSSTINALIGAKKVSVSSTPGKTKHFQTIHLSPSVLLCDCPGLVFPNFATTKAELVCNGVLPIDQLREFTGPTALVAQRVPLAFFEALYGLKIRIRPLEEGGLGTPTAEELLIAYARARGFTKTGQGQPDESRAARYILKDYVNGRLLFCHPPPSESPIDPHYFNRELYDGDHLPRKRRVALTAQAGPPLASSEASSLVDDFNSMPLPIAQGAKSTQLDKIFFGPSRGSDVHLKMPFNHKYSEQGIASGTASGKQLSGRKQRAMIALERNIDPADVRAMNSKKHFKANKRNGKHRSGSEE
ncbi:hypothetical protein FGG08_005824 [Glutinoglossum americanum]|uniref:CP-type G domain-containing protein n=1 Tax=Glutinoglossum americanum TaxID=1670608 RepID=A0A9P8HZM1_9PEZI|nr:hypothetical protein FGG08_005824 [Glutinoglossum americanum]